MQRSHAAAPRVTQVSLCWSTTVSSAPTRGPGPVDVPHLCDQLEPAECDCHVQQQFPTYIKWYRAVPPQAVVAGAKTFSLSHRFCTCASTSYVYVSETCKCEVLSR